jgi:ABC-type Zn uptake system ZnuABC Zn-binding protein ZnuA
MNLRTFPFLLILFIGIMTACTSSALPPEPEAGTRVIVVETFLADIVQNIAGERLTVETLMPVGVDPHSYQPTPQDVARIAESDLLILNRIGLEEALDNVLLNTGGDFILVEAAAGLEYRDPVLEIHEDEHLLTGEQDELDDHLKIEDEHGHADFDPHFWLNPIHVITYVENITQGLIQVDPEGADEYNLNAETYILALNELDAWIESQVEMIPPERRLLVTNHESLGYFADRYGFKVTGAIIPSATTGASPTAQDLAALTERILETGAPAIFLETGTNPRLAEQLASETGIKIIPDLSTHSTGSSEAHTSTYIEMMRYNTTLIVEALR